MNANQLINMITRMFVRILSAGQVAHGPLGLVRRS